jgi:hypothetical protein
MQNQIGFIFKLFLFSGLLSALIKYAGPFLNIPPTATSALIAVFLPTVILGLIFLWRIIHENHGLNGLH